MKVVIFGVAGFVGSSLLDRLLELGGFEIIGVDNLSYGYSQRIAHAEDKFCFIQESMRSFCARRIKGIDLVINCVAIAPLPENQVDHYSSITENVANCGAMVDFCTLNAIHKIIHFSSSAVYENSKNSQIEASSEIELLSPRLMYPVSKYLSEEYLKSQCSVFGLDVTCLRLFNLYGPKQDYFRKQPPLIGYVIKCLLNNSSATLYASREARRDYIFVDDLMDFLLLVMKRPSEQQYRVINIGSGKSYSVYELVDCLEKISGKKLAFSIGETGAFWGKYKELFAREIALSEEIVRREIDKNAFSDISLSENVFGWKPRTDLTSGLTKCYEYAEKLLCQH